uniref:Uncharacterized protein n=1 Tax=Moniliophthora roreri TaxID=221103 RepID=A0A0W0G8W9_MONRR
MHVLRDIVTSSADTQTLVSQLKALTTHIHTLCEMLLSIKKACDPDFFYNFVRPWLGGGTWVFEGEETDTDTLVGSSAAQSPLIQTLDAFLGTSDRTTKSKDLLRSMRTYMSRSHREFLEQLQNGG